MFAGFVKSYVSTKGHRYFYTNVTLYFLKFLLQWLDDVVIMWLMQVFHKTSEPEAMHIDNSSKASDTIQSLKVKLTFEIYENYAISIIDQFFSIIIGTSQTRKY